MGCNGDCLVVNMLAFYSDDLSSDSAEVYSFVSGKLSEKNEKEAGIGPSFLKIVISIEN